MSVILRPLLPAKKETRKKPASGPGATQLHVRSFRIAQVQKIAVLPADPKMDLLAAGIGHNAYHGSMYRP